jgi:hypothetical protein
MSAITICREDPLVRLVHDLFGANIVRVPDARVRPLSVVVHRGGRSFFRGSLLPLLADSSPLGVQPAESLLTDISGRRSRRIALDLGVHILRGFLKGFGIPSAELATTLSGAAYLSFAFPAVRRVALDVNALGWALAGRSVERANPAAAILFDQPRYELLLIDSVLTSRQIAIVLSGAKGQRVNVDLAALRTAVADLGGKVGAASDDSVELTLESEAELTFAFTCVRLFLDAEGRISAMPPDHGRRTLGPAELAEAATVRPSPDRVLLSAGPSLLVWDS